MVVAHPSRRSNLWRDQWPLSDQYLAEGSMTPGFVLSNEMSRYFGRLAWRSLSDPLHRRGSIQIHILISEREAREGRVGRHLDFKLLIICLVAVLSCTVTSSRFISYDEAVIHEACLPNQSQQQPVWTWSEIKTRVGLLQLSEHWRTLRSEFMWLKAVDQRCLSHLGSRATRCKISEARQMKKKTKNRYNCQFKKNNRRLFSLILENSGLCCNFSLLPQLNESIE